MQHVSGADLLVEFRLELVQRDRAVAFRRLDFNGADPVLHRRVLVRFDNEEVDLHAVRRVVAIAAQVDEVVRTSSGVATS